MSDEATQHELGVLGGTIKGLSENIDRWRKEDIVTKKEISDKLNGLPASCMTGQHLETRVGKLEGQPERLVGIGAAVMSFLFFLGSMVVWFFKAVK